MHRGNESPVLQDTLKRLVFTGWVFSLRCQRFKQVCQHTRLSESNKFNCIATQ